MTLFRFGTETVIDIKAATQEEAEEQFDALTPEQLTQQADWECFDSTPDEDELAAAEAAERENRKTLRAAHIKAYERWILEHPEGSETDKSRPGVAGYNFNWEHPWSSLVEA